MIFAMIKQLEFTLVSYINTLSFYFHSVFQVFAEFHRIASKNLEGDFYEALDKHTPRFIDLFKAKKGTMGQKLTHLMLLVNWVVRILCVFSTF